MPVDASHRPRFGLKAQLATITLAPLSLVFVLAGANVASANAVRDESATLVNLVDLAGTTTTLVHHLQAERGATNTFVASKGKSLADSLPGLRRATDTAYTGLQEYVGQNHGLPSDVAIPAMSAFDGLSDLGRTRNAADNLSIAGPDAVAYYTTKIGGLLGS